MSSSNLSEPYVENEDFVPSGTDQSQVILTHGAVDDISDQMAAASPAFAEGKREAIRSAALRNQTDEEAEDALAEDEAAAASGDSEPITTPVPTPGQEQAAEEGGPATDSTGGNNTGTVNEDDDREDDNA